MSSWINLSALWQIVVVGLLCGAGLPALFAIGVRAAATPRGGGAVRGDRQDSLYGGNPLGALVAAACFLVVLAAIAWGIYLIVSGA